MLYVLSSQAPSNALELITRRHEAILSVAFSVGKVLLIAMKEERIPLTIKLWVL
jgi:hypothetical protein